MMLAAVVIFLDKTADANIRGDQLHGWFFRFLNAHTPSLATELHGDRHSFTLSLRPGPGARRGHCALFRLTSLSPRLSTLLLRLEAKDLEPVRFGNAQFHPTGVALSRHDHPWAGQTTLEHLWSRWMGNHNPTGRLKLRFISPTAFEREVQGTAGERERFHLLFPEPEGVFGDLKRAWNRHAKQQISEEDDSVLRRLARVEAHALTTAGVRFQFDGEDLPRISKGFVGECEYSVGKRAPAKVRSLLHLLADFAFYAGVGTKTTMGMGHVVPLMCHEE